MSAVNTRMLIASYYLLSIGRATLGDVHINESTHLVINDLLASAVLVPKYTSIVFPFMETREWTRCQTAPISSAYF